MIKRKVAIGISTLTLMIACSPLQVQAASQNINACTGNNYNSMMPSNFSFSNCGSFSDLENLFGSGNCTITGNTSNRMMIGNLGSCPTGVKSGSCPTSVKSGSCTTDCQSGSCTTDCESGSCATDCQSESCVTDCESGSCTTNSKSEKRGAVAKTETTAKTETAPKTETATKTEIATKTETAAKTETVAKTEIEATTKNTDKVDTATSESTFATEVVRLVNVERAKQGLGALKIDAKVTSAANVRAKEIIQSFAHTRPNGSSFATALKESGANYSGCGENIAWGQQSPETVVKAWMNSAGHRANILNPKFTTIGVGNTQNSNGTPYWVQLFTY
ncbi:MAG: CAP domain-containing protein [Lachnospiraceae bacterium]|nr:CAP domain-containing protein [Lachnospiraceae bacterium]